MQTGALFELNVEGVLPAYIEVADMNSFSKASDRDSNTYPVFQRAPYTLSGAREQTFDVGGYLNLTDAGQAKLLAAELSQATLSIQVLWDGINGFTQPVKVNSYSVDVDPEGPEEITFSFTADNVPVIVGSGPLL